MKSLAAILLIFASLAVRAQTSLSFFVGGDADKFYPVTFSDPGWPANRPTEISIGRSHVHADASWRGTLMASFKYHTNRWGHGTYFIDADIKQFVLDEKYFVAGWEDVTHENSEDDVLIWLRGSTTYSLHSASSVGFAVYDGVQRPLPFQIVNGGTRSFLTAIQPYVNSNGQSVDRSIMAHGGPLNYFHSKVGIGTLTPPEMLSVNGKILATEVKVASVANWPDYVFKPGYNKASLKEIANFIGKHGHLPEIPSAAAIEKEGLQLGEMNKALLKKVEELTLHLIEKDQQINSLEARMQQMEQLFKAKNNKQ